MEQKQRNKIAWVLTVVFVPLLIYLVVDSVAKVRKTPSPQEPAATADAGQVGVFPSPGVEVQPPMPPVDPKVFAEQKRITALLPKNNPFNPSRPIIADLPPPDTMATPITIVPPVAPAPPPDAGIKLTAIVSRQGGAARMAMINGRFLGEGDRIAGWTIIKVNSRDVLLKDGSRQMILRLK